ncbi:MAG: carboxypeptidase-like regulatory domain-containing protein [Allomuricauda sp.]
MHLIKSKPLITSPIFHTINHKIALFVLLSLLWCSQSFAQELKRVNGQVTYQGKPISNVNVAVKNSSKGDKTNKKGRFSIDAQTTDILVFSFVGMETIEISVDQILNDSQVEMATKTEELKEVVVKKRHPRTQKELLAAYPFNKNLIKTSRGILDKDRSSVSMKIFDTKDLISIGRDFLSALRVYFPMMRINQRRDTVYLRDYSNWSNTPALFEVDGIIQGSVPTYLSPDEIDRIAVMLGNGAMARYGPAGVGGVIIINTKETNRIDELGVNRFYDNSNLMDSLSNQALEPTPYSPKITSQLKVFEGVTSAKEAYNVFKKQLETINEPSPYYYLEVAHYFKHRFKNTKRSKEILDLVNSKSSNNVSFLKSLAYHYEALEQWEAALKLNLQILKLKSRDAQSHRNLANAYAQVGNYSKALLVYSQYERAINSLDTIPYDKYGVDFLITTEADNTIRLMGEKISANKSEVLTDLENQNTRLVIEWNSDAEFELQVVNPRGYFDKWNNKTTQGDVIQITKKLKGYSSKQFFLDNDLKGEWKINVKYLGNETDSPTYLKATVYFNYGKSSQVKRTRVFKLVDQNATFKLLTVHSEKEIILPY